MENKQEFEELNISAVQNHEDSTPEVEKDEFSVVEATNLTDGLKKEVEFGNVSDELSEIQPEDIESEAEHEISADENQVQQTYKGISPLRLVARRFFRSKLSIVGIIMIVALFVFSFLGPVIYDKWGETTVDRANVKESITKTYDAVDADGNPVQITEEIVFENFYQQYAPLTKDHLLGTDDQGMDVFVRLMYGGSISRFIGCIVVILETLIGVILGGIAGYRHFCRSGGCG